MKVTERQKDYLRAILQIEGDFKSADIESRVIGSFTPSQWHLLRKELEDHKALTVPERGTFRKTALFEDLVRPVLLDSPKPRAKPRAKTATPQPEPPAPLDISPTADALANSVSALIAENEKLRNALRKIHSTTAQLLNLQE